MAIETREVRLINRSLLSDGELFMNERFEPGELGKIAMLGVAALLLWGLCLYGLGRVEGNDFPLMYGNNNSGTYSSESTGIY